MSRYSLGKFQILQGHRRRFLHIQYSAIGLSRRDSLCLARCRNECRPGQDHQDCKRAQYVSLPEMGRGGGQAFHWHRRGFLLR